MYANTIFSSYLGHKFTSIARDREFLSYFVIEILSFFDTLFRVIK